MRCPYCMNADTQVKDSRPTEENTVIRRRRVCADCGGRFTTFERIQLRELTIIKNTGRKVPFDRDKLMRSCVQVALRKRPLSRNELNVWYRGIVRRLENLGQTEIQAKMVGELVMEGLYALDQVAYVRFASVYRNFREAKDFEEFLGKCRSAGGRAASPIGEQPVRTHTDRLYAHYGSAVVWAWRAPRPIRPSAACWSTRPGGRHRLYAAGGRPHAEAVALAEAGDKARGGNCLCDAGAMRP